MKSAVARSRSFCASHLDILFKLMGLVAVRVVLSYLFLRRR